MEFLDFEIEIGLASGLDYPIMVRSAAGDATETMHFPFDELALESRLDKLQIALLRSAGTYRRVITPEEQAVQDFGRDLFNALLTGEIRSLFDLRYREAQAFGKGLRIKLRIRAPELAALPWEFMYDSRRGEFLCLSRYTPLVRYPELFQPTQPLAVTAPLRILGMIASPSDLPTLNVERERQRVEEATKDLRNKKLLELIWLDGQTWRDLQKAMRGGPWHIFHFIGHGGFDVNREEGFMALADDHGDTQRFHATQLARLLADHSSLRFCLLNACEGARSSGRDIFSSTASIVVRRGIPAVLAMQYEITDRAAVEFARAFYESIADNMPVDAAVVEARKAVSLAVSGSVEWGTPVLYMRSSDGVLFNLTKGRTGRITQPSAGPVAARLVVRQGKQRGRVYPITTVASTIGRESSVSIFVDDNLISRRHARVFQQDNKLFIEDLGSRNGTFLNRKAITEPTELKASDVIRVGDTVLEVELQPATAPIQLASSGQDTEEVKLDEVIAEANEETADKDMGEARAAIDVIREERQADSEPEAPSADESAADSKKKPDTGPLVESRAEVEVERGEEELETPLASVVERNRQAELESASLTVAERPAVAAIPIATPAASAPQPKTPSDQAQRTPIRLLAIGLAGLTLIVIIVAVIFFAVAQLNIIAEVSCKLPSGNDKVAAEVYFVNKTDRQIVINWVDNDGYEQPITTLGPGEEFLEGKYLNASFCVRDAETNRAIDFVRVTADKQDVAIYK